MQGESRSKRRILPILILCVAMCLTLFAGNGLNVQADNDDFVIEAVKLPIDEDTYNIQVTVENQGKDWEGSVRLMIEENYTDPSAYDTVISLPEGSVKQFVVRVPIYSLEDSDGTVYVQLVNQKNKVIAEEKFKQLLREEDDMLNMGILSDNYGDLTYLDMGGNRLYYYHENRPIRLQEVSADTLKEDLEALVFLIIDSYNTEILTQEHIDAVEEWVSDGGVLIIGTGAYGKEILKGFENSFLGITCDQVFEPGTSKYQLEYADISKVHVAELRDEYGQFYNYATGAMICSYNNGSIGVLPYSFTEVAGMDADFYNNCIQEDFVSYVLEDISSYSNSRYNNSKYNMQYNNLYMMRRMLGLIGSMNSPLQLGTLKVIVVIYVILVGPVLYIVLRILKKREWYWAAVPVAAVLGVLVISLAGRGFEVVDTRAYTVSVQNLADNGERTAYLYCYDADLDEWSLKLEDGYQFAGTMANQHYGGSDDMEYYHHIIKEGDSLSFGVNPETNFEDTYFIAADKGRDTSTMGSLRAQGVLEDWSGVSDIIGVVENQTAYDFAYFAIVFDGTLYVFEGLESGETCNLATEVALYSGMQSYDVLNDFYYSCVRDAFDDEDAEATSALAALGLGIGKAYPLMEQTNQTLVVGVVENWDNVVDDTCSEISYGCLYQIQ